MISTRIRSLEQLLVSANRLLTVPTSSLIDLEAYGEARERVFAQLWETECHGASEKAVVH
jgi:hypothetical protein